MTATTSAPAVRLDALGLLDHRPGLAAFDRLGDALRRTGYASQPDTPGHVAGVVERFARGEAVPVDELGGALGTRCAHALADAGAADVDDAQGMVTARFTVLGAGRVLAVLPRQDHEDGDLVYLGSDSFWFLRQVWKLAAGGRQAVELGTGTGFVAAALAPRYELTLGTDVLPATAAAAALTFRLNQPRRGRLCAVVADVAHGLSRRSFDLVVANAPWVPGASVAADGRPRTFADGGPTGQELPMRFILEGTELLAPGGVAVTQCLDLRYDDGTRPLAALCSMLRDEGYAAAVVPVGPSEASEIVTVRLRDLGAPVTAALVDVVVEHPGHHRL
jgi:hypothetical protein